MQSAAKARLAATRIPFVGQSLRSRSEALARLNEEELLEQVAGVLPTAGEELGQILSVLRPEELGKQWSSEGLAETCSEDPNRAEKSSVVLAHARTLDPAAPSWAPPTFGGTLGGTESVLKCSSLSNRNPQAPLRRHFKFDV